VVTLLTVPLLELPLDEPLVVVFDPDADVVGVVLVAAGVELVVVVVGVDATGVVVERLASAGSLPETRTSVISSQLATNSATAPPTTRRRIVRTRASRECRSACPRARAAPGLVSVMVIYLS
jgi:hypothetical protein